MAYSKAGAQSKAPLPHPRLERIAAILREPPINPVGKYNFQTLYRQLTKVKHLLGIASKRGSRASYVAQHIELLLQGALGKKIDHCFFLCTEDGDVVVWTQPYEHPFGEDVKLIEDAGGFIVNPHPAWGFFHSSCSTNVYLIPAKNVQSFEESLNRRRE
jgi:hypothetical protein